MYLFVIPGHGAGDSGATGYGYTEAERVRALATKMKEIGGGSVHLADFSRNYYADNGISSLNIPSDAQIIELHMDSASASAKGGHVIIKQGYSPDQYDSALANFIAGYFPGRAQSVVGRSDLANPNRAAARGYSYRLLECCFISNEGDLSKFNANLDAVARGILNAFGIAVEQPKKSMSQAAIQAIPTQAYTGKEIYPEVYSSANASFSVSYKNNVEVGYGQAVCTGQDDWDGQVVAYFKILPASLVKFSDVEPTAWYVGAIQKAVEAGFMSGTSEKTFEPDSTLTRAQAVCVIYRAAGMVEDTLPYKDIEQAPWYLAALEWCNAQGIVQDADTFRPSDACTREEFATMLWRWKGSPESKPADGCSEWAKLPVGWAVESGIMDGTRCTDRTTRAEAAKMTEGAM